MRLNQKLSEKQLLIINYIENYVNENGISPTIEDVRIGCKLSSKSVVSYNLNILEENGYLDRKRGMARSITSTKEVEKNSDIVNVPIVSNISAGSPLELFSSDEIFFKQKSNFESISLSKSMLKNNTNIVALKISGDSMKGDLIKEVRSGDNSLFSIKVRKNFNTPCEFNVQTIIAGQKGVKIPSSFISKLIK